MRIHHAFVRNIRDALTFLNLVWDRKDVLDQIWSSSILGGLPEFLSWSRQPNRQPGAQVSLNQFSKLPNIQKRWVCGSGSRGVQGRTMPVRSPWQCSQADYFEILSKLKTILYTQLQQSDIEAHAKVLKGQGGSDTGQFGCSGQDLLRA